MHGVTPRRGEHRQTNAAEAARKGGKETEQTPQ